MRVNPLPPQAYTKETLQKAYAWLLTQNSSVKEMAQDQNILVSLYLKALRGGEGALETPSIQNFKQELKSLASMMGDFQTQDSLQSDVVTAAHPSQTHTTQHNHSQQTQQVNTIQNQNANTTVIVQQSTPAQSTYSNREQIQISNILDAKTMSALFEVREALNLGSDVEALRALVSLGMKQFKKFNI